MSEERHKNVIEILRLELKNQQDEYTLDMVEMYALIDGFARYRERIEKLESALRQIAESKYCEYEHASGHRYCAKIAQDALAN